MSHLPEALRLADWLDDQYDPTTNLGTAASELRNLYVRCLAMERQKTKLIHHIEALIEAATHHHADTRTALQDAREFVRSVK